MSFSLPHTPVSSAPAGSVTTWHVARLRGALSLAVALAAPLLHAQVRTDTAAVALLRGQHPWFIQDGRFADVQRSVRELRIADSTSTYRWSESTGAVLPAALAVLQHIAADRESATADIADAGVLSEHAATRLDASSSAPAERALFDLGMDIGVARHAFVHRQGRVDPARVHAEWSLTPADVDLGAVRAALLGGAAPEFVFSALEPQTVSYRLLVGALATVRQQDADTSFHFPAIPARPLAAGAPYPGARALATVLVRMGELPRTFRIAAVRRTFTRPMFDAVARWQNRKLQKGRVTGVLSAPVLAALLDEYRTRGDRIAMAVERWRWLPRTFSNDPLVVNLPEFRLHSFAKFQGLPATDSLSMNVVIGRADSNATPVFAANMTLVVFSPQWHVPKSIMLKEILPSATADASYLDTHDYELTTPAGKVVPNTARNIAKIGTGIMVRQRSGDANALGKVKFLLPNQYDIYLHDTPSRSFFNRNRRDFSHGCVRLGDPMAMARYVLGSQPVWTDSKITEAMNAGVEKFVRVPKPIPVLIVYQTAVAEPEGNVRYFNDVYGHDATLAAALQKGR